MATMRICTTLSALFFAFSASCANCLAQQILNQTKLIGGDSKHFPKEFSGNASWYGPGFHGKKTASGEIFDQNKYTAAHLKLPFHKRVLVEDPRTGNTVIVKINDRGPYVRSRVMDLAKGAAKKLGTFSRGVAYVDCLVLDDAAGTSNM